MTSFLTGSFKKWERKENLKRRLCQYERCLSYLSPGRKKRKGGKRKYDTVRVKNDKTKKIKKKKKKKKEK